MIKLIIKKTIPNYTDLRNSEVRKLYGILCGVLGIICNSILFAAKLIIGFFIGSIAVISDAFNNLSDMGSSIVALVGTRLSHRSPDTDHPYGHGRVEYISALIVSFLIILFGFELLKTAINKIFTPLSTSLTPVAAVILVLSVLVKLWMWNYNRYIGNLTNSCILMATAKDSLSDVVATSVVLLSALLSSRTTLPIDGAMGAVVSFMIIKTGWGVAKDTIDRLLGQCPDDILKSRLEKMILENNIILGMHSLMVHDYGPNRRIASAHAEVPDNLSLVEVHQSIDDIEHRILTELNVDIVLHMDPVPADSLRIYGNSTYKNEDFPTNVKLPQKEDYKDE